MKKESERFIFEAQEQALRMNWIKKTLMAKRYQKNVEYVRKEMSQSLTLLCSVKSYQRKSRNKGRIILPELYNCNYATSLG